MGLGQAILLMIFGVILVVFAKCLGVMNYKQWYRAGVYKSRSVRFWIWSVRVFGIFIIGMTAWELVK